MRLHLQLALTVCAAFIVVELAFIMSALTMEYDIPHLDVVFVRVIDRPIIEQLPDVEQSLRTRYVTFNIGDEHFVIEQMPSEYLIYSARWSRMP